MESQTALQVLDQTVAEVKMTRQDHFTAMQAVETLQRTIHENQTFRAERDQAASDAAAQEAAQAEAEANAAANAEPKQPARPSRSRKK